MQAARDGIRHGRHCNYWNGVLWSPSYLAASCDGATPAIVREYIAREQTPLLPAARADPEKNRASARGWPDDLLQQRPLRPRTV
jgi:hypothetical protein